MEKINNLIEEYVQSRCNEIIEKCSELTLKSKPYGYPYGAQTREIFDELSNIILKLKQKVSVKTINEDKPLLGQIQTHTLQEGDVLKIEVKFQTISN